MDGEGSPRAALPREVAERLRPQLTAVVTEVVDSIAEHVPSYARPLEGSFGQDVRSGVQVALARFLDELAGARGLIGRLQARRAQRRS